MRWVDLIPKRWRTASITDRVRVLRWLLPLAIASAVFVYQLGFTAAIHARMGSVAHTVVELLFYSVVGPVATWLILDQISQWLTAKEAAEQAVRVQERHLASIAAASADAILSLDPDATIRSWNRGATMLFGYRQSEMVGKPFRELLPPPARFSAAQPDGTEHVAAPLRYEGHADARDGRRIVVDVTETPLLDNQDKLVATSVVMRDITPRKAREALLEAERARIARDLHDGLAQNLYFVGLKLDFVRKLLVRDVDAAEQELSALTQTIQRTIRDVRRTIFALRPVDFKAGGLESAVRTYIRDFGEQANLEVVFETKGDLRRIPPALEPEFFHLVQEGLNNIAKHAEARHASICLEVRSGPVGYLAVEDDGIGLEGNGALPQRPGKLGLRQMQERVTQLRGSLALHGEPGKGTRLEVQIPL